MPVAYFAFPPSADVSVTATGPSAPVQTGGTVQLHRDGVERRPGRCVERDVVDSGARRPAVQRACSSPPAGAARRRPPARRGAVSCTVAVAGCGRKRDLRGDRECGLRRRRHAALVAQSDPVSSATSDPAAANNVAAVAITAANPAADDRRRDRAGGGVAGAGRVAGRRRGARRALGLPSVADNCGGATLVRTGVPAGNLFPVGTTIDHVHRDRRGRRDRDGERDGQRAERGRIARGDRGATSRASSRPARSRRLSKRVQERTGEFAEGDRRVRRGPSWARHGRRVHLGSASRSRRHPGPAACSMRPTAQSLLQRLTGVSWLLAMQEPGRAAIIRLGNAAAAGGHYSTASGLYWLAMTLAKN